MKTCPGCGKEYRKGAIVILFDSNGKRRGARVCQGCADGGMTVVAVRVAPKVAFADKCIRQLRTFSKLADISAHSKEMSPEDRDFFRGRAEGLDAAIEVLKGTATKG